MVVEDPQLQEIQALVRAAARAREGNATALLALLRLLEALHREIETGPFNDALPRTRRDLYNLLLDMETHGGWPYIYRRSLESLLTHLRETEALTDGQE
ncbi:MAG: hypothetical protein NZL92_00130 [Gloeomargarita sp. SKYG116]|nr:hypothetical protein [Gloeomargarita sp. SKYG116]MCS7225940.1 hypothetical protein [Gloeomargarita sp. SKYB31]MDW8400084.1 hypothetical protein [Gloeomargarita sp. SKYGB_i_bin116]